MLKKINKLNFTQTQIQLTFFISFIFLGSLYANLFISKNVENYGLVFDFFSNKIESNNIVKTELFEFILLNRIEVLMVLWIAGFVIFTLYINIISTSYIGFCFGLIFSSALIYNGFRSYILMFLLFIPQYIIYIPIYIYLINKNHNFSKMLYKNRKVSRSFKINGQLLLEYFLVLIISALCLFIGVFLEAYVNPDIIRWYV